MKIRRTDNNEILRAMPSLRYSLLRDAVEQELNLALCTAFAAGNFDGMDRLRDMADKFEQAAQDAENARYNWAYAYDAKGGAPDTWACMESMSDAEYMAVMAEHNRLLDAEHLYNDAAVDAAEIVKLADSLFDAIQRLALNFSDYAARHNMDAIDTVI